MRYCLLGMFLFMLNGVVTAQNCNYTLTITVVETHNFSPVYPSVVFVEPLNKSFETNERGEFVIDKACAGEYIFHVHAVGYMPKVDTLMVSGSRPYKIKISLEDHQLKEVEVTGQRQQTVLQPKEQMNREGIVAGSGKSLGDLLQAVNGVSTLGNGATIVKPVIHGLHSNRIMLLNNGIRQEDQQWGNEHAPNIDPFLANTITVIKGAAGVRYGTDAIGGVVLVEPAPLTRKPGWNGEVNMAGFGNNRMGAFSGMMAHNFKKLPALSFRVQGTYKQGGNYRIPGYWAANTGVKEVNYSAALGYKKLHYGAEVFYSHFNTHLGIYRGSHTGNMADLTNAINSSKPLIPATFTYEMGRPKQHVSHDLVKAKIYQDSRIGLWTMVYGYQHNFRQEYDVLRKENGKAQLNLTLNTQTLNLNLDHKPLKGRISGQAGIDAVFQDNFFRQGDRLFIPTYRSFGGAAYLIERYKKNNWQLEGGLRYDYRWYGVYNPEGNAQTLVYYDFLYSNPSGTLGFNQQLKDNWQWGVTFANAWRAPQASELFSAGLHHGAARVEIGNKSLLPEQSYSLNAETKYVFAKKLTIDASVYSQLIDRYIYLEPGKDLLTIRGYFKTFNYKQTDAMLNGADVSFNYRANEHLDLFVKGSTVLGKDRTENEWLVLMPSDRVMSGIKYSTTISPNVMNCFFGIDGKYVFQQKRIPSYFDVIDFPRPPKGYFLLDLSAGGDVHLGKQPLNISLSVLNALNAKYRDYMDVFRYFIDQPGTNVVLRLNLPLEFSKS
jgi:iron complex outermembrane receptor protein